MDAQARTAPFGTSCPGSTAGCEVFSFKQPSARSSRRFLWRTACGYRNVANRYFNRSYYEEVLITRFIPKFSRWRIFRTIARAEGRLEWRYRSIVDFEEHLIERNRIVNSSFTYRRGSRQGDLSSVSMRLPRTGIQRSDIHERKYWRNIAGLMRLSGCHQHDMHPGMLCCR